MSLSLQSTSNTFTTAVVEGDKAETIAPIVSGTAVTASGTSIDFTGIPNWVKRVTVLFNGVSLNGVAHYLIQIGSATIQTTGYNSGSAAVANQAGNSTSGVISSSGFILSAGNAASVYSGAFTIYKVNGNNWVGSGWFNTTAGGGNVTNNAGAVSLTGNLDRIRITTSNGTDTFDAGTVNITWE